ncbi:MAG TPA: nucleotide sugar epimerase [Anaerolineaceae bacterium]|uniref:NAD-dependent epimerase/dehydratase family protein n=1 Tax=Anaerolinea thermophila TaxID=167964 RepID=A0A101FXT7_9CHLR|nr:MAG: NAD-dependent epimerase/dehydratase family protein [Anaerolinea thermophila]HAF61113.1 nucleotide sugar epimerase [Anaerolineaceae bacterium]
MGNYFVTGAAGFIASKVCEFLLQDGHTVIGIDNFDPVYDVRLKEWRLQRLQSQPGFTFYRDDICEYTRLKEIVSKSQKIDGIINLAAKAGVRDSVLDPWAYYNTNVNGTLNLLEICKQKKIHKFILASTSSIYGDDAPYPTSEEADSSHPLQPYAASKKAAETLSYSYHYLEHIDVTVVRYFTVYGPAGRPGMSMFRFAKWIAEGELVTIFGDGNQTRGFTYVDDIARGTIQALKPLGYEIINLGGHQTISINDLVKKMESLLGKKASIKYLPAHPADMNASWADVSKARELLGWQPQVTLEKGIPQLINWYMQERPWASQVSTE